MSRVMQKPQTDLQFLKQRAGRPGQSGFLPEIDDEVLVSFSSGSPRPIPSELRDGMALAMAHGWAETSASLPPSAPSPVPIPYPNMTTQRRGAGSSSASGNAPPGTQLAPSQIKVVVLAPGPVRPWALTSNASENAVADLIDSHCRVGAADYLVLALEGGRGEHAVGFKLDKKPFQFYDPNLGLHTAASRQAAIHYGSIVLKRGYADFIARGQSHTYRRG